MSIHKFNNFINERFGNNEKITLNLNNIEKYSGLLKVSLIKNKKQNLLKGLEFTLKHINEYNESDIVKETIDVFLNDVNLYIDEYEKGFFHDEDKGYSGYKSTGKMYKHTIGMSRTELAKLIKKELKANFPDWDFKVKTHNRSIDVEFIPPYNPYSEEMDKYLSSNSQERNEIRYENTFNAKFQADNKKINDIYNQYNYNDSDAMVDYFDVRYYGSARLDEYETKLKYYPNNPQSIRYAKLIEEEKIRKEKNKEIADKRKGKFKKGDKVIFVKEKSAPTSQIPDGEYVATINKVPNGRARFFSYYSLNVEVTKVRRNGQIVELSKPIYFTVSATENELKPYTDNQ